MAIVFVVSIVAARIGGASRYGKGDAAVVADKSAFEIGDEL